MGTSEELVRTCMPFYLAGAFSPPLLRREPSEFPP